MSHLTDEQLEQHLAGEAVADEHLRQCPACRQRLEDHRAVRERLRTAFAGVRAGEDLRARLHQGLAAARRPRGLRLRLWSAVAAAAMVLIAVPAAIYLARPATAAAGELAAIHDRNLTRPARLLAAADPAGVRAFFQRELGLRPALPDSQAGVSLRGCCTCRFRGAAVGTYVVETADGPVSIVVLAGRPESLEMISQHCPCGCGMVKGSSGACNVAARRLGGYTYAAVGKAPYAVLARLLHRLVVPEEG